MTHGKNLERAGPAADRAVASQCQSEAADLSRAQALSREVHALCDAAELDSPKWRELCRAAANVDGWIYAATYIGGVRPFSECEREACAAKAGAA